MRAPLRQRSRQMKLAHDSTSQFQGQGLSHFDGPEAPTSPRRLQEEFRPEDDRLPAQNPCEVFSARPRAASPSCACPQQGDAALPCDAKPLSYLSFLNAFGGLEWPVEVAVKHGLEDARDAFLNAEYTAPATSTSAAPSPHWATAAKSDSHALAEAQAGLIALVMERRRRRRRRRSFINPSDDEDEPLCAGPDEGDGSSPRDPKRRRCAVPLAASAEPEGPAWLDQVPVEGRLECI